MNTAISTGEADNQLEFLSSILDKLSLESSFFGAVGPAKSLYHIHSTVKTTTQGYEFPSDSLPNLNARQGKLKMLLGSCRVIIKCCGSVISMV